MDKNTESEMNTYSPIGHDITNGADPNPKTNPTYSFGEEYKQIFKLMCHHSPIYIGKFLFLIIIVTGVACFKGDSYSTLIISSFTLSGSLLFDQLCKKKIPENFDFIRAEKFCSFMTFYVCLLFMISLLLLAIKDDIFPEVIDATAFSRFKWFIFCLCCSADFSALVEAIANIPEQSLPSMQEKSSEQIVTNKNQNKGE